MKWSRDLWKREKMIDRGNGKMTTDSRLSTAEPPVKRETEVSSEGLDRGGGVAVSYTHLRAHETADVISYAVFCFFNRTLSLKINFP